MLASKNNTDVSHKKDHWFLGETFYIYIEFLCDAISQTQRTRDTGGVRCFIEAITLVGRDQVFDMFLICPNGTVGLCAATHCFSNMLKNVVR
jgi:hypothetical protein